jgi:hypothetical protein
VLRQPNSWVFKVHRVYSLNLFISVAPNLFIVGEKHLLATVIEPTVSTVIEPTVCTTLHNSVQGVFITRTSSPAYTSLPPTMVLAVKIKLTAAAAGSAQ